MKGTAHVLSYIFLRGKCSACGTPISLRYPLVEITTGALFLYCIWRWGATPTGLVWCGFAAAFVTLAVCIGANATVFTVLNSMVLRPLPVPDSDRLILMGNSYPGAGAAEGTNSGVPDYFDRRNGVTAFEEQALFDVIGASLSIDNVPRRVTAMATTPSLFPLLRVPAHLGRWFTEDEGEIGREQKVMLSYAAWQQILGGEASAIGRDLRINGQPYEVVGVMPRDFLFLDPEVRLWIPLAFTAEPRNRNPRSPG